MPKTSRELAQERNNRGFTDKYLADSVAEGDETVRKHEESSAAIERAYMSASQSSAQRTDLEPTIARDPDAAMAYFQRVLMPNKWRSNVIEDAIRRNRGHYHKQDMEMFDSRENQAPKGMSAADALKEALKFMSSNGKTFPELEAAIATDLRVIAQYVGQVLKPKNLSSAIILDALRKKMDSDPDAVLGILLSWSRETALTVFTEYIERIAMSDPGKMVAMYDRWKSELDSDILRKIVERSRPKTKQADLDRIRALIVKARSQK
jgi:hypothetical protein